MRRLAAVDRKLDLIMAHPGIREPEPDVPGPVLQELLAVRKIQAIKEYREATGAGLKEAKDAVELLATQRGME
ncbi:ribosomal protein L7/L12 [Krasilnikovia sp. MM14-A1259]|uniref:ribosomal protein L7/L12 n=1 Tax=Krasilnikovia sp. MM14-A1259 TaxID=3373539 RepID=UPI00382E99A7